MTHQTLPQLEASAKTLDEKVASAISFMTQLAETFDPTRIAVAWTAGKDSTVALALWRECLGAVAPSVTPRALSIDTGCKFPEVVALRDDVAAEWGLDLTVARPDVDLAAYPLAQDKVACCRDLKVVPLGRTIREQGVDLVLSGVRADEHPSRAARPSCEARQNPDHVLAHPVLYFTEMDVWAYIMDRGLPYCSLYADGYRSLGCVPCTARADAAAPERAGRDAEKERNLEVLHSLGYF